MNGGMGTVAPSIGVPGRNVDDFHGEDVDPFVGWGRVRSDEDELDGTQVSDMTHSGCIGFSGFTTGFAES